MFHYSYEEVRILMCWQIIIQEADEVKFFKMLKKLFPFASNIDLIHF